MLATLSRRQSLPKDLPFSVKAPIKGNRPRTRTPENQPKCIIPGPGKFLKSQSYVCANPGKFWDISGKMCVSNLGNSSSLTKAYVTIWGNFFKMIWVQVLVQREVCEGVRMHQQHTRLALMFTRIVYAKVNIVG